MWLTKKQVSHCKIWVNTPKQSKRVQELLFSMNYRWSIGSYTPSYLYSKFLYIGHIYITQMPNDINYFNKHANREIYYHNPPNKFSFHKYVTWKELIG